MTTGVWVGGGASVIGRDHVKVGSGCQDANAIHVRGGGEWVAAAVSDGAGTAKRSDEGARLVTRRLVRELDSLAAELSIRAPGAWVNDFIIQSVLDIRRELRVLAGEDSLTDFHCTVVACLVGPRGGLIVHIGDGFAVGARASRSLAGHIEIGSGWVMSSPENGEYANETFFVTEGSWIRHLRITPVSDLDWILLGTDGGAALAMAGPKRPNVAFLEELIAKAVPASQGNAFDTAFKNLLDDARFDSLTGDDKSLIVLWRPDRLGVGPHTISPPVEPAEPKASWTAYPAVDPPPSPKASIANPSHEAEPTSMRARGAQLLSRLGGWQRAAVLGLLVGLVASLVIALSIQVVLRAAPMVGALFGWSPFIEPAKAGLVEATVEAGPRLEQKPPSGDATAMPAPSVTPDKDKGKVGEHPQ